MNGFQDKTRTNVKRCWKSTNIYIHTHTHTHYIVHFLLVCFAVEVSLHAVNGNRTTDEGKKMCWKITVIFLFDSHFANRISILLIRYGQSGDHDFHIFRLADREHTAYNLHIHTFIWPPKPHHFVPKSHLISKDFCAMRELFAQLLHTLASLPMKCVNVDVLHIVEVAKRNINNCTTSFCYGFIRVQRVSSLVIQFNRTLGHARFYVYERKLIHLNNFTNMSVNRRCEE